MRLRLAVRTLSPGAAAIGASGPLPPRGPAAARHPHADRKEYSTTVAVKIKLARFGKIREPYYRIVVADSRTHRDGRAIENIGKYHPKAEPASSRSTPTARSTGSASARSRPSRCRRCSR